MKVKIGNYPKGTCPMTDFLETMKER